MVGVRDRNTCHTCRRKRIKCDQERPRCGQCRRSVVACEGYDAPTLFLNSTASSFSTTNSRQNSLASLKKKRKPGPHFPPPSPSVTVVPYSLHRVGLVAHFLDTHLPPPGSRSPCTLVWFRDIPQATGNSDLVGTALLALASSWVGRQEHRQDLRSQSLQLYSASTHRFHRELFRSEPLHVLATATFLMIYELVHFGAGADSCWDLHTTGMSAAMNAASPQDLHRVPFRQLSVLGRSTFMIRRVRSRGRQPGTQKLWTDDPFKGTAKNAFQELIDLGLQAADLLHKADALRDGSQDVSALLTDFDRVIDELARWESSASSKQIAGPSLALEHFSVPGTPSPEYRNRPPNILLYESVNDTRLLLMCWTIKLTMLTTLLSNARLRRKLSSDGGVYGATQLARHCSLGPASAAAAEADEAARTIVAHAWACYHSPWPSFGTMLETWAVEVAAEWYSVREESENAYS